jgi:hypothetical protein
LFFLVKLTEPFGLENYIGSTTSAKAMVLRQMERLESSGSEGLPDVVFEEVVLATGPAAAQAENQNNQLSVLDAVFDLNAPSQGPIDKLTVEQELDKYLKIDCLDANSNPLLFWRRNEQKYPRLFQLAKVFLSIPASSGSVERLFSIAGSIARARRARLSVGQLEKILLVREYRINS